MCAHTELHLALLVWCGPCSSLMTNTKPPGEADASRRITCAISFVPITFGDSGHCRGLIPLIDSERTFSALEDHLNRFSPPIQIPRKRTPTEMCWGLRKSVTGPEKCVRRNRRFVSRRIFAICPRHCGSDAPTGVDATWLEDIRKRKSDRRFVNL